MNSRSFATFVALALMGCDRKGTDLLPENSAFAPVVTIGELGLITQKEYWDFRRSPDPHQWCTDSQFPDDDATDEEIAAHNGLRRCFYGQLGMPEAGVRGGASYTFTIPEVVADPDLGIEQDDVEQIEEICVMMDPETVFWNHSVAEMDREDKPLVADYHDDDGDLDMNVGLSSLYTGSPGVELGDFRGLFTDSLGRTIEIEYGECIQVGSPYPGEHHSGRGTLEYCDINVEGRAGLQFTVVLETFSVPLNDGALGYGTMVYAGPCNDIITIPRAEQVIPEESMVPDPPEDGDFDTAECTKSLELAVSAGVQQAFCCVHPDMCSGRAPDDACEGFAATYDPENEDYLTAAANFCAYTPVFQPKESWGFNKGRDKVDEYQSPARQDNSLSLKDFGFETTRLCCDEYAVVSSDVYSLEKRPVLPDAVTQETVDEELWDPEFRIPWTSVEDFYVP